MESCGLCGSRLLVHGDCIACTPLGRSHAQPKTAVTHLRLPATAVVESEPSRPMRWLDESSAAPAREPAPSNS